GAPAGDLGPLGGRQVVVGRVAGPAEALDFLGRLGRTLLGLAVLLALVLPLLLQLGERPAHLFLSFSGGLLNGRRLLQPGGGCSPWALMSASAAWACLTRSRASRISSRSRCSRLRSSTVWPSAVRRSTSAWARVTPSTASAGSRASSSSSRLRSRSWLSICLT